MKNEHSGIETMSSSATVLNTIVRENASGQILQDGGTLVIYSNIQDGFDGIENIDADPLFVDEAKGDYHLQLNSPCADAGQPVPQYNDTDGSRNNNSRQETESTYQRRT
jgi:hypothetical protein